MRSWQKLGMMMLLALGVALLPVAALGQEPGRPGRESSPPPGGELEAALAQGRIDQATFDAAQSGEPFEAIVVLDDRVVQAASSARRGARGLRWDDPAELQVKAQELSSLKASAFTGLGGLQVLDDPQSFALTHVRLTNALWLTVLLRIPSVSGVFANSTYEPVLAQSLPLIGQPAAAAGGFKGAGASVAIIDTGLDYTKDAFDTRAGSGCTAPNSPASTCRVVYTADIAPNDGSLDDSGHGTNVAGIALGVAPDAKIIGLDVFRRTCSFFGSCSLGASSADIISAMDWVVQNRATYNIVAINLSLGDSQHVETCSSWATSSFAALRNTGVIPVVAAGNGGYVNNVFVSGVSGPACAPGALSVGAVYDSNIGGVSFSACTDVLTAADKITCFSQTANSLGLLAPGGAITAAGVTMYGTSQATPHVTGAVAVLAGANPASTVSQREAALKNSGPQITDTRPSSPITKRRLALCPAIAAVGASCTGGPPPSPSPSPSPSPAVSPSPSPSPSPSVSASPSPSPSPSATTQPSSILHVGDLDGSASTSLFSWSATITVRVHDQSHNNVSGAVVTVAWSGARTGTATCTTSSAGTCTVSTGSLTASSPVTATVTSLAKSAYTYNAASNHDPESDSNGTAITVSRPSRR